jgi:signal transduction histidine kinase
VIAATVGGWLLAVAALRPVERMRREAAATSGHDSVRRLPVPTTRDELASLAETMNAPLDRLHGALERQRAFVADAGHELRTPLAVLKAELELAQRSPRTAEELRDAVRHADVEIERLARLADALLLLARDDADQMGVQGGEVTVGALLERSVRAFGASATDRGVHIDADAEPDLVVALDEDLVRRAVDNLLENAVRHAPPGSAVEVRARRNDQAVEISVRDEGPGFADEFLPHAFERFQRADDARARRDGGAGLGLAIVAAVARAHHGSVHAANASGGGAVVTLVLPVSM